jgi:glycosyltransferase involved in cell wall biosynthesis
MKYRHLKGGEGRSVSQLCAPTNIIPFKAASVRPVIPPAPMRMVFWHWGQEGAGAKFTCELVRAVASNSTMLPFVSAVAGAELARVMGQSEVPLHEIQTFNGDKSTLAGKFAAFRGLMRLPQIRQSFDAFLVDNRIDIAICTMSSIWDISVLSVLGRRNIPFLLFLHDATPHPGDDYPMRQYCLRREVDAADGLVVLSEHVRRQVAEQFQCSDDSLWMLPHGAFHFGSDFPRKRALPHDRPVRLLFLGRILPYKGLSLLLEAYGILHRQGVNVELDIVGSGDTSPYRAMLQDVAGVSLNNKWLEDAEIDHALRRADVMILPYLEASQSGVAVAATTAGVPIIATPVGGLAEQVIDGKTGLLTQGISGHHLAATIKRLLEEPGLYEHCSIEALHHAQTELNWEGIGAKVVDIAADLFRRRRVQSSTQ